MAKEGSIAIPTGGNISKSLNSYGIGLAAGLGFNMISGLMQNFGLGGGIIPGAIAAALTGAIVPGEPGKIITTTLGFNLGMRGFANLGLGSGLSGLFGGLGGGGQQTAVKGPSFQLI